MSKRYSWNMSEKPKLNISAKLIIRSLRFQRNSSLVLVFFFFSLYLEQTQSERWHILKELKSRISIQAVNAVICQSYKGHVLKEQQSEDITTFQGIVSCLTHLICHSIALWVWADTEQGRHLSMVLMRRCLSFWVTPISRELFVISLLKSMRTSHKQLLMLLFHIKSSTPQEGSATRCHFDLTCTQERWKWVECIISARICRWQNALIAHGNQCRAV